MFKILLWWHAETRILARVQLTSPASRSLHKDFHQFNGSSSSPFPAPPQTGLGGMRPPSTLNSRWREDRVALSIWQAKKVME